MNHGGRNGRELIAEATLGNLEPSAIEVLRRLVDQFDGRAELLYSRGEWSFSVRYGSTEEVAFGAPELPVRGYEALSPVSSGGFSENEVGKTARRALGLAEKP